MKKEFSKNGFDMFIFAKNTAFCLNLPIITEKVILRNAPILAIAEQTFVFNSVLRIGFELNCTGLSLFVALVPSKDYSNFYTKVCIKFSEEIFVKF